jgi:hypothetical protein
MTLLSSASLIPVKAENADHFWPEVEDMVRSAADMTGVKEHSEWLKGIKAREAQLWVITDGIAATGVIITDIYETAKGKTVGIPIAAGEIKDVANVLLVIEHWAREVGAVRLEGCGRAGWERALKPFGWSKLATVVEKEITP